MIQAVNVDNFLNPLNKNNFIREICGTSYKDLFSAKLTDTENFEEMWQSTLEKYFGKFSQNFYHVADASGISQGIWTHNDFPYDKFFQKNFDSSILSWQPTRKNPPQTDSAVQNKIHATLGKNSIVVPPELDEKLKTDSDLRKKVIANIEKVCKFHTQPVPFKMPGVKEYGTKIYGAVIVLNADGEVENCAMTSGGTILGPDEETLRQIKLEQKRKLKRKIYNRELLKESTEKYLLNKDLITFDFHSML